MALKSSLLVLAVLAAVAATGAQAQLGRILISGIVPCSNGTLINAAATPVFPNATVQLRCGNRVITSATTNSDGVFAMSLDLISSLLSTLLSSCNLIVNTPLASCNASLSGTGILQSALQLLQGLIGGLIGGILNLAPSNFSFIPQLT
ncbi:phylloplanin-like [Typha latifolia]|uniref:phylloplanin-like n=1 Tax=Typha latifolia TaxID=4733 RepID=UPI003C2C5F0F